MLREACKDSLRVEMTVQGVPVYGLAVMSTANMKSIHQLNFEEVELSHSSISSKYLVTR